MKYQVLCDLCERPGTVAMEASDGMRTLRPPPGWSEWNFRKEGKLTSELVCCPQCFARAVSVVVEKFQAEPHGSVFFSKAPE
jgi:hypothetical protein